ncbi:MAG: LysM peptidoglycan-binding domain-containing protein [Planctomycetes bacterium]|nr:LysM peptidoglycan-binding domain-containing protein [Planctomycetota bacterium]
MRKLLLFVSLALLLGAAALWQQAKFGRSILNRTAGVEVEEKVHPDRDEILLALGGGPPPLAREPAPTPPRAVPLGETRSPSPPRPAPSPEAEVVVRRGDTLSGIVRAHYGSARPALIEAVRVRNALTDAGRIREGAVLHLPPLPAER